MRLFEFAKTVLCRCVAPWATHQSISRWPIWMGDLYRIKVPSNVRPNPAPSAAGAANINIILDLIDEVAGIDGDVAECGVYRGETIVATALYLQQCGSPRQMYGFDSFEGFDDSVEIDLKLGGTADAQKARRAFADTSYELIAKKLRLLELGERVHLIKGYFRNTLPTAPSIRYAFVHLDCDLYQSYKDCLEYFYDRMAPGGIILLDEYDDPPWPGCNQAVDEFMAGRPEKLERIERDNHIKRFIRKS